MTLETLRNNHKFPIILLLFISFWQQSLSQTKKNTVFDPAIRAVYIFDIAKLTTWPNEKDIKTYQILVLEHEPSVYPELKKLTAGQLIKGKPIEVKLITSEAEISACQVLFVMQKSAYQLSVILEKIAGHHTLLMTEDFEFHKSMINLKVVNGSRRYEVNEKKISEAGLRLHPAVMAPAIKTQADWEALYEQTDHLLTEEKKMTEQLNHDIEKQQKTIESQKVEMNQQSQKIASQRKDIEHQQAEITNQKKALHVLLADIALKQNELTLKREELEHQHQAIAIQTQKIETQNSVLKTQTQEIEQQVSEISKQKSILKMQLKQIESQKLILLLFGFIMIVLFALGFFIWKAYQTKRKANILLEQKNNEITQQNAEILQQKEEIEAQRDEIEQQRDQIEIQRDIATQQRDEIGHQKQEITDSILYARRIQTAVLPPQEFINKILPHHFFILNQPRDIVSGDYYWMAQKGSKTIFAVADCTGHGVPGAFMSMLGVAFLNEIVNKAGAQIMASEILNQLRDHVMKALHQTGKEGESKDGMDIALGVLDLDSRLLEYAGANNPLYLVRPRKNIAQYTKPELEAYINIETEQFVLYEVKADKMPIGIFEDHRPFRNHSLYLGTDDTIYLFSDGYADQFGGPNDKKFKYKPFKETLVDIQPQNMTEQREVLYRVIEDWKGDRPQVDDIMVMGIRI